MSILDKTATVSLPGRGTLIAPCPSWCIGHDAENNVHPDDFTHYSDAISIDATPIPEGRLDPTVGILNAGLSWTPFSGGVNVALPCVTIAADEASGWRSYSLHGLADLIDQLEQHLPKLRALHDQLRATIEEVVEP